MAKYGEKLPMMQAQDVSSPVAETAGPEALAALAAARMRCSGCGAKVCLACPCPNPPYYLDISGALAGIVLLAA